MRQTDGWPTLLWVLLGAFVLRAAFGFWWQARLPNESAFFFGDSESYWELGKAIASGEPYQFGSTERKAFRAPGYPIVLAPLFLLGGDDVSVLWARMVSALFGTATVAAIWWLAKTMFDSRVALAAAAIAAVYPGAVATSGYVLAESPFGAAMILQLGCWYKSEQTKCRAVAAEKSSTVWAFAAGAAAGAAALLRPSWLLFTPMAGVLSIFLRDQRPWKRVGLNLAAMATGLCLVMAPWWIRNTVVFGRFVPTTLQVGASWFDGWNPEADGSSDMRPVDAFEARFRAVEENAANRPALHQAPFEVRLDSALRQSALHWAIDHPADALQLAVVKFARLWNIWPNDSSMRSWPVRMGVACSFIPIALAAVVSLWRCRRRPLVVALLLLPAAYFTLLHVVFVSSIRYRQPAMLALIVLAAAAIAGWPAGRVDLNERHLPS